MYIYRCAILIKFKTVKNSYIVYFRNDTSSKTLFSFKNQVHTCPVLAKREYTEKSRHILEQRSTYYGQIYIARIRQ